MGLSEYVHNFSKLKSNHVSRNNYIKQIEDYFKNDTIDCVVIDGGEGIGKTTILTEFVLSHLDCSITFFIRNVNKTTCNPDLFLLELANQMCLFTIGCEIDKSADEAEHAYNTYLYECDKLLRRSGKNLYCVIDGLEHLTGEYQQFKDRILSYLPIGRKNIKVLLSGSNSSLNFNKPTKNVAQLTLVGLSIDEIKKVSGVEDDNIAKDIFRFTSGNPAFIESVQRLISSNTEFPKEFSKGITDVEGLYEYEWKAVNNDNIKKALAIILNSKSKLTIKELSVMVEVEENELNSIFAEGKLKFVEFDEEQRISFASDSIARFASKKLSSYRLDALNRIILFLHHTPNTKEKIIQLPELLYQAGKYEELLEYLNDDYVKNYFLTTTSLVGLRKSHDLAGMASKYVTNEIEMLKFTLRSSLLLGCQMSKIWKDEIEALMALGEYEKALNIVQAIQSKEIRFHMLAILSSERVKQKLPIDQTLIAEIEQLMPSIDFSALSLEEVFEIAVDVVAAAPELAFKIIKNAAPSDVEGNAHDYFLAQLIIATSMSNESDTKTMEKIHDKISDPNAKSISNALLAISGDYSATEIINRASQVTDISIRLLLLRKWARSNVKDPDAIRVIDEALNIIITSTEYSPNALVFRELAEPLPFIIKQDDAKRIISFFDGQAGNIKFKGPMNEYVKLVLLISKREWDYDINNAQERLIQLYFEILDIHDLSVRVPCLALLQAHIEINDPERKMNDREKLHDIINDELPAEYDKLLCGTANHYEQSIQLLDSLSPVDITNAKMYATRLNTQTRRDNAFKRIILSYLRNTVKSLELNTCLDICDLIHDIDTKDQTIASINSTLAQSNILHEKYNISHIKKLHEKTLAISNPILKCEALCFYRSVIIKINFSEEGLTPELLLENISKIWATEIPECWERILLGYRIIKEICKTDKKQGIEFLRSINESRQTLELPSPELSSSVFMSLLIAIRAFSGIVQHHLESKEDLQRLLSLITMEEDSQERAILYNDLALRLFAKKRRDLFDEVGEKIQPFLEYLRERHPFEYKLAYIETSPALFIRHQELYYNGVSEFCLDDADLSISRVIMYFLTKLPTKDPYDYRSNISIKVNYEDALNVVGLITHLQEDKEIYYSIKTLVDTILPDRSTSKLTREQISSIANNLQTIVDQKLPNPNFISHIGYKVLGQAQVDRLNRRFAGNIQSLASDARTIDNMADRAFVLTELIQLLQGTTMEVVKTLTDEAYQIIKNLPSLTEKTDHLHGLSRAVNLNNQLSKQYLKEAFGFLLLENYAPTKKRIDTIIDTAYKLDPEFAASLTSQIDDDEARYNAKQATKDRLQLLDTKKQLIDGKISDEKVSNKVTAKAAWRMLASLNGGSLRPQHMHDISACLLQASSLSIEEGFPIFSWIIENAIRRIQDVDNAKIKLQGIFDACLGSVEFIRGVGRYHKQNFGIIQSRNEDEKGFIRQGERDSAIDKISKWWQEEKGNDLILCDPYFCLEDLEIINVLWNLRKGENVYVLCSNNFLKEIRSYPNDVNPIRYYWRRYVSECQPPATEVIICVLDNSVVFPIHDRWILSEGSGLSLGTSFNSLGSLRITDIQRLSEQFETKKQLIWGFVSRKTKEYANERVDYQLFST